MNRYPTDRLKWVLLILLSCIWGSSFILIKIGLKHYGYVQAATIRLCTAGLIILPFAISQFKLIPKNKWLFVFLSGFVAMFLPAYLFCFAQTHVPSSVAGIINTLTPTFTFLISLLFFKTKYSGYQVMGLLLGLFGSVYLSLISSNGQLGVNPYAMLIVLAAFLYGLNINIVKQYLQGIKPWAVSTCSVAIAGLLSFILVLIPNLKSFEINQTNIYSFLALALLGLLGTAAAIALHNELIKISSALFASANTYLIPIVAIGWGILFNETISLYHIFGVVIILVAITLIRKQGSKLT